MFSNSIVLSKNSGIRFTSLGNAFKKSSSPSDSVMIAVTSAPSFESTAAW